MTLTYHLSHRQRKTPGQGRAACGVLVGRVTSAVGQVTCANCLRTDRYQSKARLRSALNFRQFLEDTDACALGLAWSFGKTFTEVMRDLPFGKGAGSHQPDAALRRAWYRWLVSVLGLSPRCACSIGSPRDSPRDSCPEALWQRAETWDQLWSLVPVSTLRAAYLLYCMRKDRWEP